MSMDTVIFFDAERVDGADMVAALKQGVPAVRAVEERYRTQWRIQRWQHHPDRNELKGPGGFLLTIAPQSVQLYHITRFSAFTHDDEARTLLLAASQSLAQLMGASRMLVTHELMPISGQSLAEIAADLRDLIGPPAQNIQMLRAAQPFQAHAWWLIEGTPSDAAAGQPAQ